MKLSPIILCSITLLWSSNTIAQDCDFIQYNQCYSCDDPLAFEVGSSESCTYLCPNRTVNIEGSGSAWTAYNCALKECPKDRPFAAQNGSCFASPEEAENNSFAYNTDNTYVPDFPDNNFDHVMANNGKCPDDKPLKNWDDGCYSCNEKLIVRLDTDCNFEKNCEDICPNRTVLYAMGGNIPSIPNCPPDKPLMDREGICYPCDAPIAIGLRLNERLCEQACPNQRVMAGVYCHLLTE